jgi:AcrR family transcriptional regulator
MPKEQRSPEEIESVRRDIMEQALELIVTDGFDGLSMRKLAKRLGIAAKTIYNYFHNKDELYLYLLTRGFEDLLESFEMAVKGYDQPMDQFKATVRAYVAFGLKNANIYNLMFTWHVPKYNDYVGTPMEQSAREELTTALKCADFFMARIAACLGDAVAPKEEDVRCEMIQVWSHMHGYVAGINNSLLDYLHEDPITLKERIIERIIAGSQREMSALKQRLEMKIVAGNHQP